MNGDGPFRAHLRRFLFILLEMPEERADGIHIEIEERRGVSRHYHWIRVGDEHGWSGKPSWSPDGDRSA